MGVTIMKVWTQRDLYTEAIRAGCQYTAGGSWHTIDVPVSDGAVPLHTLQDVPILVIEALQHAVERFGNSPARAAAENPGD